MITLASHKTLAARLYESAATAVVFFYTEDSQVQTVLQPALDAVGNRPIEKIAIRMHDVQPGHNRGLPLPSPDAVLDLLKFLSLNVGKPTIACDARGRGLATAAAIIACYLKYNAARKAFEEIGFAYPKASPNGFVLRIADAILSTSLGQAADNFAKAKYVVFKPAAYRAEIAAKQAAEALAAAEAKAAAEQAAAAIEQQAAKPQATEPSQNETTEPAKERPVRRKRAASAVADSGIDANASNSLPDERSTVEPSQLSDGAE